MPGTRCAVFGCNNSLIVTKKTGLPLLLYDEVEVSYVQEYDVSLDQVVGPHNQMQVVMARGLFSNWKQPIYIAFDQKITKCILLNLITELHKISFNVVACVSDCGSCNVGLWKELDIDVENTSFKHPETGKNIFIFADAPHLLKLIRNWLIDYGFMLEGNIEINKGPLEILLQCSDSEVRPCYEVTQKHLNCEKSQRQNVRLAAQLLSNTVATALLRYKPGADKKMAEQLGNFIYNINFWFDIFNSYSEEGVVPSKSAYGTNLKLQEKHLNKMIDMIFSMRAIGKKTLQIFQKGMIISMKSLKALFEKMKSIYDVRYICTHKLNQDALEFFFFQLRSRGPNEHPSPLTAVHRIRLIILGKNPGILSSKVNTVDQKPEEFIVAKVMEKADISISDTKLVKEKSSTSSFSSSNGSFSISFQGKEENSPETGDDAGYLAKKFKKFNLNLGDYTHKIRTDHSYNLPSWVQQLSYGGLIKPTAEWLDKVKKNLF